MEDMIARGLQFFLALAGAYLLALWFALVVWTYRDIVTRSTNPITHVFSTLVVVLFFVPGALIYLILRPRETLDEAFQRTLEEEYLLQDLDDFPGCPVCRRAVRDDFVFCPHCSAELRQACRACHRSIDLQWEICPYCGSQQYDLVREPSTAIGDVVTGRGARRGTGSLQPIDGGRSGNRAAGNGKAAAREDIWQADESLTPVPAPEYDSDDTGVTQAPNGDAEGATVAQAIRRPKARVVRDQG